MELLAAAINWMGCGGERPPALKVSAPEEVEEVAGEKGQEKALVGTDECILCFGENLADVLFPCGHRVLCQQCCEQWTAKAAKAHKLPSCPTCRAPVTTELRLSDIQCHPVCISRDADGMEIDVAGKVMDRMVGAKIGSRIRPGDAITPELLQEVKDAMSEVNAGRLERSELEAELRSKLTGAQIQLVYVELSSDADLHNVVLSMDQMALEDYTTWKAACRQMIIGVCEAKAFTEMTLVTTGLRATATTAAATGVEVAANGHIVAGAAFSGASHAAAASAAGMVCLLFGGFELYRWSKGEISGKEAGLNCGEHLVGGAASVGGIAVGGTLVAATGCATAGVGVAVGFVLAVVFGLASRYGYRWYTQSELEGEKEEESRLNAVKAAAFSLGINIETDDFHIAKLKFRAKLLQTHPDKFGEAEREAKTAETAQLLIFWQLVRGYYDSSRRDNDVSLEEDEGFFNVYVKKVRRSVDEHWRIVRTWLGQKGNAPLTNTELEVIEERRIYV